jgi:membrane-associated phospholipid phosphatase
MTLTKKLIAILFLIVHVQLFSQNIDIRLLRSFNSPETLPSDNFFKLVSNSDAYLVFGIPVGMGTIGLIRHNDQLFRNACVTLAATAVTGCITEAMKYAINRNRPFITYPDIKKKSGGGSPSFPSGHTSSAFTTATSLSLSYPKWYIILPAYTWAGTVAYSRMDLGVHYPSDVLAGAIVGAGSAWLTYAVNKKLNKRSGKKSCNWPEVK